MANRTKKPGWTAWAIMTAVFTLLVSAIVFVFGVSRPMNDGRTEPGDIEALMARMSLEEKVGQLLMSGFDGTTFTDQANTLITQLNIGGVILFDGRNMTSPEQTARLTRSLQRFASAAGAGVGLFIATDEEGGSVSRLPGGAQFPGQMALGATGSAELAEAKGKSIGSELSGVGINVDFAPVVDVNSDPRNPVIGIRSFGSDPDLVGRLGAAEISGLQSEDVVAVAKHFPGHGDTDVDSHVALPLANHDLGQLTAIDLPPFQKAIAGGVGGVMVAHILVPALGAGSTPASLSAPVIDGVLRQRLGYDGVVFTDALEMGAIVKHYGLAEAAVRAIAAGADVVLVAWPGNFHAIVDAQQALLAAVKSGRISKERLDAAVRRVLKLKQRFHILRPSSPDPLDADAAVRNSVDVALAATIAHGAITLIRDRDQLLPIKSTGRIVVLDMHQATHSQAEGGAAAGDLGALLQARRPQQGVVEFALGPKPDTTARGRALAALHAGDTVVAITDRAWNQADQRALIAAVAQRGLPQIVVMAAEPYDVTQLPGVSTVLATYSSLPTAFTAAADVLMGRSQASGHLPVAVPGIN
ncbi:MAG TPA: glycoside hydrolase family 3 N-terminal domain-containing protein [Limnochordia bacterium]|nr:glycoside hydrolase family 3 N-terminal domain-containing protein [Limnochordia bacterium]